MIAPHRGVAGRRRLDPEARRASDLGGTMRLGRRAPTSSRARSRTRSTATWSPSATATATRPTCTTWTGCREAGLVISALTQREKLTGRSSSCRRACIRGSSACSSTPSSSPPAGGHPLFKSFIAAALKHQAERTEKAAVKRGAKPRRADRPARRGESVRLDRPLAGSINQSPGPCVVESEQLQVDVAGRLEGNHGRSASRSSSSRATTRPTARSGASFRGPHGARTR